MAGNIYLEWRLLNPKVARFYSRTKASNWFFENIGEYGRKMGLFKSYVRQKWEGPSPPSTLCQPMSAFPQPPLHQHGQHLPNPQILCCISFISIFKATLFLTKHKNKKKIFDKSYQCIQIEPLMCKRMLHTKWCWNTRKMRSYMSCSVPGWM